MLYSMISPRFSPALLRILRFLLLLLPVCALRASDNSSVEPGRRRVIRIRVPKGTKIRIPRKLNGRTVRRVRWRVRTRRPAQRQAQQGTRRVRRLVRRRQVPSRRRVVRRPTRQRVVRRRSRPTRFQSWRSARGHSSGRRVALLGNTYGVRRVPVQRRAMPRRVRRTTRSTPSARALASTYGIRITGSPRSAQLRALRRAAGAYPQGILKGLTIHFESRTPPQQTTDSGIKGLLRGVHYPDQKRIVMYRLLKRSSFGQVDDEGQTTQVLAHEIAHHIMDSVYPSWAHGHAWDRKSVIPTRFGGLEATVAKNIYPGGRYRKNRYGQIPSNQLVRSNIPGTKYAFASAQKGDINEVTAEMLSLYALGAWSPRGSLRQHLNQLLRR